MHVVVAPLLVRLAQEYPQALYFPFHVSKAALEKDDSLNNDPERKRALDTMRDALASTEMEQLVAGFADLHNPDLRMVDALKEIQELLKDNRADEAADHWVNERKIWMMPRKSSGAGRGRQDDRGSLYEEFCKEFLSKVDQELGSDGAQLRKNPQKAMAQKVQKMRVNGRDLMAEWVRKKVRTSRGAELSMYM